MVDLPPGRAARVDLEFRDSVRLGKRAHHFTVDVGGAYKTVEVLPDAANTDGKFSRGKSGEFILTDIKVQVRRQGFAEHIGPALAVTVPRHHMEVGAGLSTSDRIAP